MKKNQEPKTKDVYRLWWEYLKRSEKYSRYCENPVREPYKGFNVYDHIEKYACDIEGIIPDEPKKRTKKQKKLEDDWWPLFRTWELFGDVFYDSFEEWWKRCEKTFKKNVIDLDDRQSYDADILFHFKFMKIDPDMGENLADVMHYGLNKTCSAAFVAIPLTGNLTIKEISQQISKILKKRKKEKLRRIYNLIVRYNEPIGRVRYDELKRYLEVYDMRQRKMSIKEIIKKIWPGKNDQDNYVTRQVYSDIKKAKTIIKNVEQGYFPSKSVPSEK